MSVESTIITMLITAFVSSCIIAWMDIHERELDKRGEHVNALVITFYSLVTLGCYCAVKFWFWLFDTIAT